MGISKDGWSVAADTGDKACPCGSWKEHWLNYVAKPWPATCTVQGCPNPATVASHVTHPSVPGVQITPLCGTCAAREDEFTLDGGITLVNASVPETCGKDVAQARSGRASG